MTELPNGWISATINDVANYVQRGKSPKYAEHSKLPVINQKCIRWHGIDEAHLKYVDPSQWDAWGQERFLRAGDILWNSTGTGTIGRASLYTGLKTSPQAVVDSHVTIVRPNGAVLGQYLHRLIQSPSVQSKIDDMQSGSTNQVELGRSEVLSTQVPLPPLPEQRRITAKIDDLCAKSKRARDQLDHIPRLVEKYKQAILAAAFRGELTREWRRNSDQVWNELPAAELFEWSSGKNLPSKQQAGGDIPVIGGNGVSGHHNAALIDFPTLVIGRVGAQCGNVHRSDGPAWVTDNAIYAKSISESINLDFAVLFFRVSNLNSLAGGTGQPYVNQTILNKLMMPVPSVDEQRELVRRVDTAFAWIDRLASEATSARKLIDHLDQAVLAKAFRGELVPQDPNDEPASVLLERIHGERQMANLKKETAARPIKTGRRRRSYGMAKTPQEKCRRR